MPVDPKELTFDDGEEEESTDTSLNITATHAAVPKPRRGALTMLRGPEAGRMYLLQANAIIGRDKAADVHVDNKALSRRHARVTVSSDRYYIEDLGSSNGTFVEGERLGRDRTPLVDGARIALSPSLVFRFNLVDEIEERVTKALFEASTRDGLTGLYNRRYLDERLAAEVSYAHRHKEQLGFLMFDIDHFKKVNDTHGHLAGDAVLAAVGQKVAGLVRAEDVVARYGGEEIAMLVRGISLEGLKVLGERVRRAVSEIVVPVDGVSIKVTVSVGIACLAECDAHATGDLVVALADERLYRAKSGGRNRVCAD